MQGRVLSAVLSAALVATPVWAGKTGHGGGRSSGAGHGVSSHAVSAGTTRISGGPSAGTVPETMSGYHSSAGYGSLYGWGYNDWTRNGWHDGTWHAIPYSSGPSKASQPTMKFGGSKASSASADETQLIQQQIARRRAQQAQRNAAPSQTGTPATSSPQH